ncbi:N-methyltransferase 9 Protein arginine [Takifugu flavidus]|uniref:Protein arginine N-methyltransferase 9 n=2 Tax=Takifugu flavidus TaxID=433684 RepID=A0A5C6MZC7_9TELE|nr:N-methyltransferase 9 Protein arginine [Takifugu flavidus]
MPNTSARSKHGRRSRRRVREDPAKNELVSSSLESARQCLLNQDYGTAFVHYLLVLNLAPLFKDLAKESFRFTLFKWSEELDSLGRIQDLFDCYEQALELFPTDEVILNSMGEHLFRMGFRDEAAGHFHKALKVRPDYPEARENFHRVANWLVERWHFFMLNDYGRNRKYQQAIQKAVQSGCNTVLDIGTGTGILGMCAKKAGAAEVYACELSKTMYELAREVVTANGMDGGIKILHMKSLEMEIPKDIPQRVSLVVTETVDAGLFGEGIIESLIHAWHHLLLPPQRGKNEFQEQSVTGRVIPAGATSLSGCECGDGTGTGRTHLQGGPEENSPLLLSLSGSEGELDALTVWFQLHLDEENSLSTGPQEDTCWEQAVYPVHNTKGFLLKPEDELVVEVSCRDAYLRLCSVAVVRNGREIRLDQRLDTQACENHISNRNPEAELCSALSSLQTEQNPPSKDFCSLESSEIALLNNHAYHQSFRAALAKLISQLKGKWQNRAGADPGSTDRSDLLYVLDVSEGFSLLSLIAASHGHVKAYSSVEKKKQQEVLKRLATSNNIPEERLEFWLNHVEDEQGMLKRPSREKLWSGIMLDCVETCGLIRQKLMEKASLARCLLEDGGRVFPEKIVVYGTLVESDTLLLESAVQGREPTLGFNIAPFINQFTVPVHVFLDFSTLDCKHLSQSVELFVLDLMDATANYTHREVKVQATAAGRITAVPFWYNIYLDQEISVSTLSQNSHWKQAAAVLQEPLEVGAGEWLRLSVKLHKSTISISVDKDDSQ